MLLITWAIIVDTLREALARKVFWAVFGLSTLIVLFFLFLMRVDVVEGANATFSIFGKAAPAIPLDKMVRGAYSFIAVFLYGLGMFVAVFASAGLTPSVLEPGRIELLLSKPVPRWLLLCGRFLGNLVVVGSNFAYLVVGVWTILGAKTGVWLPVFLVAIPVTLFIFAVLLCLVVYLGVLWENSAVAIMVTFVVMIFSTILAQRETMMKLLSSEWSRWLWQAFYYALPKVHELGGITLRLVNGEKIVSWMPVWSSALFGAAALGHAMWIFRRRDY